MAHIFNHSNPGLNQNDIYVIVMRDFESQAYILVKALTANVTFRLESYFDINATLNAPGSFTDYTINQAGEFLRIDIPESGNAQERVTRMLITNGRLALDVTSPSHCRVYIEQPESPPRIATDSRDGFPPLP